MNHLPLTIIVNILAQRDSDTVTMKRRALVPFIPCGGIKIRLYNSEDEAVELELTEVVFDTRDSTFVCELEDNEVREGLFAGEPVDIRKLEEYYKAFGFVREYHRG